jgi:hypothetical protein
MARIIETLAADWRRRDERVEEVSTSFLLSTTHA